MLTRQSYFRDSESDCSIRYLREMSHDVMQSFVTLSANSPYFTIKTESFAHALGNDDSAQPRNCSIVTRPFPSLRAGSGYETIVFHTFRWPFFFIAKVLRMRIGFTVMLAEPQGNTQLAQRLSTTFSLAQNYASSPCWSAN